MVIYLVQISWLASFLLFKDIAKVTVNPIASGTASPSLRDLLLEYTPSFTNPWIYLGSYSCSGNHSTNF